MQLKEVAEECRTAKRSDGECLNLRNEKERLKSFSSWPAKGIKPDKLAKLGFFYTQSGDKIQCAFCGIQLSNWSPHCDPSLQHKMHSNDCDFLRKGECGNITT